AAALLLGLGCASGETDSAVPGDAVRVGYIAPSAAPASFLRAATYGARRGSEEASHAARLVGESFEVRAREARNAAEAVAAAESLLEEGVIAIVAGFDDGTCRALSDLAEQERFVFMNVGCSNDSLRAAGER